MPFGGLPQAAGASARALIRMGMLRDRSVLHCKKKTAFEN